MADYRPLVGLHFPRLQGCQGTSGETSVARFAACPQTQPPHQAIAAPLPPSGRLEVDGSTDMLSALHGCRFVFGFTPPFRHAEILTPMRAAPGSLPYADGFATRRRSPLIT